MTRCMPLIEGADSLHQEEETVCPGGSDLTLCGDHHNHGHERHPRGDEPSHRRLRGMLHLVLSFCLIIFYRSWFALRTMMSV